MNHLNGSFNAQQVKAIEKYVADFVAAVLKDAGEGNINPGEYKAPPKAAPKAESFISAERGTAPKAAKEATVKDL